MWHAFLAALLPLSAAVENAEDVARLIERHHQRVVDMEARFVQSYRSGLIGREVRESGTLRLKRPARMRWEYLEPERKTFVLDGQTSWFYVPADHQVIRRQQGGLGGVAAILLSGEGSLLEQFQVALEASPGGRYRLRLEPKAEDPELARAHLEVDADGRVLAVEIVDAQGSRSRFEFDALRENTGLRDDSFRFQVPAGVEVIG